MMPGPVKIYENDLTPEQCQSLKFFMIPKGKSKDRRPKEWIVSSIIKAIMYVVRSGCQWRMLPIGFIITTNGAKNIRGKESMML